MRSRKRLVAIGLLCPTAGLALAGGWSVHLGLNVRDHLQATRDALVRLRASSDLADAPGALAEARRHAGEALRLTSGPDWSLLARTPEVGASATTVRGLAEAATELTGVLATVHQAGTRLIPAKGFSMDGVGKLLAGLESIAPTLREAVGRIERTRSRLAATPAGTGLDTLDQARDTALREVDRLRGWLRAAADAAALLPPMLGHHGERRYFLAFQTNAEARATGGLVGAFGILKAGNGRVGIERLSPNNGLVSGTVRVADHGPAFLARYGPSGVSLLANSNLSPHFPYAATTWTALWERQTRRRLDGAIATDPVGLSYLLKLIGPVKLPGGETVTSANVVDLTERAAYSRYRDSKERERFLITIAGAVSEALSQARPEPTALISTLSRLVDERRIQIWSRRDAEERQLVATPLGGVLPQEPGPFAGLVINNSAGTKLDYYLERSLDYDLGPCRPDGTRVTRVRVRLTNDVPREKLPTYVTDRLDSPEGRPAVGSNLLWVSLYAAVGARTGGVRIDGEQVSVLKDVERSHPVYSTMLELAPRQSRTLEFLLLEPASPASPAVPVQPLARPQQTRINDDRWGCATVQATR